MYYFIALLLLIAPISASTQNEGQSVGQSNKPGTARHEKKVNGEQIYPRKWNHDFIGLPIVQKEKQHRPTVTETELGEILACVKGRVHMLFALLAGTGPRIGEALGLKTSDLSPDCRVLHIQRSIWRGQEQ